MNSSGIERLSVKQKVDGASPSSLSMLGVVAQLVRALALQARGRGFDSHWLHLVFFAMAMSLGQISLVGDNQHHPNGV